MITTLTTLAIQVQVWCRKWGWKLESRGWRIIETQAEGNRYHGAKRCLNRDDGVIIWPIRNCQNSKQYASGGIWHHQAITMYKEKEETKTSQKLPQAQASSGNCQAPAQILNFSLCYSHTTITVSRKDKQQRIDHCRTMFSRSVHQHKISLTSSDLSRTFFITTYVWHNEAPLLLEAYD